MSGRPFRLSTYDEERKSYDPLVHAQTVIDSPHRLVHDGMVFTITGKSSISSAATAEFLLSVPAGVYPHFHFASMDFGGGDVDLEFFEDTTTSADGTPVTSQNVNRNSSNTPGLVMSGAPTVTADGDNIYTLWAHNTSGGSGNKTGIANVDAGTEWILKPSTKYLIRLTNNNGNMDYAYQFYWYEVSYDD